MQRYLRKEEKNARKKEILKMFELKDAVRDMDGRRFDGARLIVEFARDKGDSGEKDLFSFFVGF